MSCITIRIRVGLHCRSPSEVGHIEEESRFRGVDQVCEAGRLSPSTRGEGYTDDRVRKQLVERNASRRVLSWHVPLIYAKVASAHTRFRDFQVSLLRVKLTTTRQPLNSAFRANFIFRTNHNMSPSTSSERALFGGAITAVLRTDLIDASYVTRWL